MDYFEWKWTKSEPYDRSPRQHNLNSTNLENNEYIFNVEKSAYSASLNHDENSWDVLNKNTLINKKEYTEQKLSERQNIGNSNLNPYLSNNNYVDDIVNQNKFLQPISTNNDKEQ